MSKSLRTIILFILAAVSTVANYAGLSQSISEHNPVVAAVLRSNCICRRRCDLRVLAGSI